MALFETVDPSGRRLTGRALERRLVLAMTERRPRACRPRRAATRSGRRGSRRTCRPGGRSSNDSCVPRVAADRCPRQPCRTWRRRRRRRRSSGSSCGPAGRRRLPEANVRRFRNGLRGLRDRWWAGTVTRGGRWSSGFAPGVAHEGDGHRPRLPRFLLRLPFPPAAVLRVRRRAGPSLSHYLRFGGPGLRPPAPPVVARGRGDGTGEGERGRSGRASSNSSTSPSVQRRLEHARPVRAGGGGGGAGLLSLIGTDSVDFPQSCDNFQCQPGSRPPPPT